MDEHSVFDLTAIGTPVAAATPRRRRRHPAVAGRIIATGVGSTAFFGSVAGIAAHPPTWANATAGTTEAAQPATGESDAATAPPSTTMVLERVARTFYVDQAGNPVAPPGSTTTTAVPAAQTNSMPRVAAAAGVLAAASEPASGVPRSANSAAPAPAPTPTSGAPANAPGAPAPTPTPAPGAPAPAPTPTAPPTTAAPAPKPTTPPTTVPACKTSKC